MFTQPDHATTAPHCAVCHQALSGDPEDHPNPPLGPLCGECYRAQQMDDEVMFSESVGQGLGDDLDF